jgi:hypothetical protein
MIHIPFHWTHEETVLNLLKEILINQELQMAQVAELQASLDALTTAVNALIAKPSTGIQPSALDPIKTGLDNLTTAVNSAVAAP